MKDNISGQERVDRLLVPPTGSTVVDEGAVLFKLLSQSQKSISLFFFLPPPNTQVDCQKVEWSAVDLSEYS